MLCDTVNPITEYIFKINESICQRHICNSAVIAIVLTKTSKHKQPEYSSTDENVHIMYTICYNRDRKRNKSCLFHLPRRR